MLAKIRAANSAGNGTLLVFMLLLFGAAIMSLAGCSGLVSGNTSSTTTPADTTPPTVSITSPAANATVSGTVTLTASATDNVAVASVQFKVDNVNIGTAITAAPYNSSLNTTTLSNGNHTLTAVATDTSGNITTSAGVTVKVSNTAIAPSIASLNPTLGSVGTSVTVTGANFGATQGGSSVKFNGTAATPTSWSATNILAPVPTGATTGNVVVTVSGLASNGVSFTVVADTVAPTVPTGLTATAVSSSQINLAWTASTDNVGVTGYKIFRGGTQVGTSTTNSFSDMGLTASTNYSYSVSAFDAAGNTSAPSASASATTLGSSASGGGFPLPGGLGWHQVPNTNMSANNFAVCPPGRQGDSTGQCGVIMQAWTGAILDQNRNRMVMCAGGGHTDYSYNECYGWEYRNVDSNGNWAPRIVRYTAGVNAGGSCVEPAADGISPTSRHTYGGVAYLEDQDKLWVFGGSLATSGCASPRGSWTLDLSSISFSCQPNCTPSYTRKDLTATGTSPTGNSDINVTGYDFVSKLAYYNDTSTGNNFVGWDPAGNVYTCERCGHSDGISSGTTGEVDPYNRFFVIVGNGNLFSYDLRNPSNPPVSHSSIANCGPLVSSIYPGLTFNSNRKTLWGYPGSGNVLYEINVANWTCTTHVAGSTAGVDYPTAGTPNGIFGRFRYAGLDDVIIYCPDENHNCWFYRQDAAQATDTNDFATRCASPGVTLCQEFANVAPVSSGDGYYLGSDTNHPAEASVITPSGTGTSLQMTFVGLTQAGGPGFWRNAMNASCGTPGVINNCDIYVQYRYRLDEGAFQDFGTQWKVSILHNGGVSCGSTEITIRAQDPATAGGMLIGYGDCGAMPFYTYPAVPNQVTVQPNPPYYKQQGDTATTGFNCVFGSNYLTDPTCMKLAVNNWNTIYQHVHIANMTGTTCTGCWVEMWSAPQGQALQQFINSWQVPFDGTEPPYDTIDLLPYMTGKSPTLDHAPMRVWYAEMIVGTQPILPPTGPTPLSGQHP